MGTKATDVRRARLKEKMDAGCARFEAKTGTLAAELQEVLARIDARFDSLMVRLNIAMFGIVVVILVHILLRVF